MTQGGTWTRDLANGLPHCSQLSYQVTQQLLAEFEYLWLSCQGSSQSGYQAGMFNGKGAASAKCEPQAQLLNMLQTWQSDLTLSKSLGEENTILLTCAYVNHWSLGKSRSLPNLPPHPHSSVLLISDAFLIYYEAMHLEVKFMLLRSSVHFVAKVLGEMGVPGLFPV